MDNLDDSENNAKVSDSAYSNSCSNSQSRRSHSSKSTHSGSNSSGSSGYGGQPSTSGSSNQLPEKRSKDKDHKTKKQVQVDSAATDIEIESLPIDPIPEAEVPKEVDDNVDQTPMLALAHTDKGPESMDISSPDMVGGIDDALSCSLPLSNVFVNFVTSRNGYSFSPDGFSCVISMHDGVVMYTTSQLTATLGFPKDMWIGRSFIDFVHPRDRSTFASQITSGLAIQKIVHSSQETVQLPGNSLSMVCRIRRYRGLASGFGVKERVVTFMPFLLKLSFKSVSDEKGDVTYLVLNAVPFFSAFKVPNEIVINPVPFVIRHAANGNLEYLDPESVPYLGYLPQDVIGGDALKLYHPDDLCYLRQVYKTIVKEGGLPKSKPYRMLTQNGHYIRLETEWSSYINPWSRKLEFVIGKHCILEGPTNPDVFQSPDIEAKPKIKDDEKNKHQAMRDNIIKILNEVLTKPAEVAKQQMSKRCQDLASFMETLLEEQPKTDEELRLEIQDADHSYYERDSMLGGISPHHEYNDSKSSTETPLSYNQLNYNDNLQRYFDSHQPISYEDYNTVTGENVLALKDSKSNLSNCLSPLAQYSGDSVDVPSSCESGLAVHGSSPLVLLGDYQPVRLTETLINKHNSEMEKELYRAHRVTRSTSKSEREKTSNENRQKKKEHLARCNASFQPAAVATTSVETPVEKKSHGVKRSSKQVDMESVAHKHHCSSRHARRRHVSNTTPANPITTNNPNAASSQWQVPNPMNNMNAFVLGMPQQMSIINPVMSQQMAHMSGMFLMYYVPSPESVPSMPHNHNIPSSAAEMANNDPSKNNNSNTMNSQRNPQFQPPAMQCMMYGQAMYGSPFMYQPMTAAPPGAFPSVPTQQNMTTHNAQFTNTLYPLGLTSSNYEEACKLSVPIRPNKPTGGWRNMKRGESQASAKTNHGSADSITSINALNRESGDVSSGTQVHTKTDDFCDVRSSMNSFSPKSTEPVPPTGPCLGIKPNNMRMRNSDEGIDKTDGESSYSSFYSSFFKTDSGSAEESGDMKKSNNKLRTSTSEFWDKSTPDDQSSMEAMSAYYETKKQKKVNRRKMEPPWMEQVCVTSDLIYKYQILTKTMDEVLSSDKQKMSTLAQPSLVNEQLGQLYLDLQLEGVAARLTLEDGITSSSSSGEETCGSSTKGIKRKRDSSKLVMIYEEDAPLPPPPSDDEVNRAT